MSGQNEQLIARIDGLKHMLESSATNGGFDGNYVQVRSELLREPSVKGKLPKFVTSCRSLSEFWDFIKPQFAHYYQRRKFIQEAFDPVLTFLEQTDAAPVDGVVTLVLAKVDSSHVQAAWQKALERRGTDPEGAITAARTLLEAVCKHILDELKLVYEDKAELPKLYGLAASALNLAPSQHTETIFKQILGGCHAVVEGLGALRNRLGDAHGTGKHGVRPAPRHAELAVNLAGAMATFLVATWEARTKLSS